MVSASVQWVTGTVWTMDVDEHTQKIAEASGDAEMRVTRSKGACGSSERPDLRPFL